MEAGSGNRAAEASMALVGSVVDSVPARTSPNAFARVIVQTVAGQVLPLGLLLVLVISGGGPPV
jgi:hypothetical protein